MAKHSFSDQEPGGEQISLFAHASGKGISRLSVTRKIMYCIWKDCFDCVLFYALYLGYLNVPWMLMLGVG